ncbi:MAG: hypothetical protein ACJ749_07500 [Flavisolibacter sp.]
MRYLIIVALFLFTGIKSQAQWKNYIISRKGDTLNRVDMKGLKQGPWSVHVDALRGEDGYEEEGFYKNDLKEGAWRRFTLEGDLIAYENYAYGMKDGKCSYFTISGEPIREESWRAIDPKNPYDTVDVRDVNDPSKIVKKVIVKVEPISYKNGTWRYYNTMTGAIETTEQWVMNRPKAEVDAETAGTGDLAPIDVTDDGTGVKKDTKKIQSKPQAILDYEKKNSGKKKVKVRDGSTGG